MAVTGGGSLAISDLLTAPGASQTVLEVHVPYSPSSLARYLSSSPEQACSHRTARALAMTGFLRALDLADESSSREAPATADSSHGGIRSTPAMGERALSERVGQQAGQEDAGQVGTSFPQLWGVGCTASLRSHQPKRGEHRFHVALQTPGRTLTWSLTLTKSARTRIEEERLTADFLLALVAEACCVPEHPQPSILPDEQVVIRDFAPLPGCGDLLLGRASAVRSRGAEAGSSPSRADRTSLLLFPGAFNPPHPGHIRMAEVAERRLGKPIQFEISMENVDKPLLDYQELSERIVPFSSPQGLLAPEGRAVWFTRAPTFVEKSLLFPAATFVVGMDTAIRIADPRYYAHPAARDAALATLRDQGCRFLVFGRIVGDRFETLDHVSLPSELRSLCMAVSAEEFRDDHSSSAIRRQTQPDIMDMDFS